MRSILAASDRSGEAESLVRTAGRIAGATGAALHLLHSTWPFRPDDPAEPAGGEVPGALRELSRLEAPVEVEICEKPLREAVLDHCIRGPVDLVVLGSGDQPGSSLLAPHLDVVQVALRASGAVLVTRESLAWPPRRILVPVSRPDVEHGTIERTVAWLIASGSAGASPVPPERQDLQILHMAAGPRELRETTDELLRQLEEIDSKAVRAAGIDLGRRIQREPGSVERALRRAERERIDLIVLRRHEPDSKSPDPAALIWLRMLNAAPCSVLLLPRARHAPAGGEGRHWGRVPVTAQGRAI